VERSVSHASTDFVLIQRSNLNEISSPKSQSLHICCFWQIVGSVEAATSQQISRPSYEALKHSKAPRRTSTRPGSEREMTAPERVKLRHPAAAWS